MTRPTTRTALGTIVILLLAACSSSGAPPADTGGSSGEGSGGGGSGAVSPPPQTGGGDGGSAASIDSCALLSDEELRAATGQAVISRTPSTLTQVFPSVCDIEFDDGASLTVSVMASGGRSTYEASFEPFIGENELLEEAVPDLGDKAGRQSDDYVMVLSGDVLFDLQYLEFGRSDSFPVVRHLAEVTIAKLPCIADGCAGFTAPTPPPAAAATDACTLLTNAEIEEALGYPVVSTEPGTDSSCRWGLETDGLAGLHAVEVVVLDQGGRSQFDLWANDYYEVPPDHLTGLGDDAIMTGTSPAGAIHAVLGDRLVSFIFSLPMSASDPYGLVESLAKTALPRLP